MRTMCSLPLVLLSAVPLLGSCVAEHASSGSSAPPAERNTHDACAQPVVQHWGAMRDVLRDGHTQGRVSLDEVVGPHTVAVGAVAGLAAEITIDAGTAHLAEVVDPDSAAGLHVRPPAPGEQATLLVLANVREWSEHTLPDVPDLATLERTVRSFAVAQGIDVAEPFPFRVEGTSSALRLHVLNHSCPIADPNGPQPWTFNGQDAAAVLIGFYSENAAGRLTHHGQKSHVHALLAAGAISGHLDDVRLPPGAQLFLPSR